MLSPTCQAAVQAKEKRTPLKVKKSKDGKGDGLWLEAIGKMHKACKGHAVRMGLKARPPGINPAEGQEPERFEQSFICDCDCHWRLDG